MIGGFLGAGKTTSVLKFAEYLQENEITVGIITNDQASNLVDSKIISTHGFDVEEIAGGCFCCRFESLKEAADKLSADTRPDVIIAEPVGSCTDLVATVSYPLRRIYGDNFSISPLSVLVDPIRARRILGLDEGKKFSPKVSYIYMKQMEEADLIVINKCDLLNDEQLCELHDALAETFPASEIIHCSARYSQGLEPWFAKILSTEKNYREAMTVDYQIYGEGEAELGWLNATLNVNEETYIDGNKLLVDIAIQIRDYLNDKDHQIAHLKMTLSPSELSTDLAVLNLVRNDMIPEESQSLQDDIMKGELIINLRAEADPDTLKNALAAMLEKNVKLEIKDLEHFSPSFPVPVHRDK
ncbi:MAG: cobalamin biosynthesis protein P47K [Lentisphaeria bacterium]|nr:cobalamin biosynthesis protein P47K [Lentisphaeria bacterium]